ncbi:MAG TPA: mannose-1-phosphate guanylyltransferase/mannose-6-phosphate isomerase [Rhodanobacteraceae bacterium]|jgi:mannose-1-phosphate guanylyltransferase/mannose-6-phosphate isomerase
MDIQPVILSGGSGTRLWPASREHYPKQLLPLVGEHSMLQATLLRLEDGAAAPILVGNEEYRFVVAEQVRRLGIQHSTLLLEPVGRNTAPALTLAALLARTEGNDPVLLVMPADHAIGDVARFRGAIAQGAAVAEEGAFVTFGIRPTRAETGYGYLRRGAPQGGGRGLLALEAFVEKPDAATAQRYLESGEYLWNSGIFLMRASVWLRALELLQPRLLLACKRAMSGRKRDGDFVRVDRNAFAECPSDSIDYAVMEKLRSHPQLGSAWIVPLDARWSDIGTWAALWEAADKDAQGNVSRGKAVLQDTRNSLVFAGDDSLAVVVGCEDLVVVDTPDALLVSGRHNTQEIRRAVAKLKVQRREEVAVHRKVYRPWGWYDSIGRGEGFQVKRISVNPGASLSLQMHHHRAEHWVVVCGTARVTRGDDVFELQKNDSTFIPSGTRHRLQNLTERLLEVIEVQCGDYLGEDDIVRIEDVYSRV